MPGLNLPVLQRPRLALRTLLVLSLLGAGTSALALSSDPDIDFGDAGELRLPARCLNIGCLPALRAVSRAIIDIGGSLARDPSTPMSARPFTVARVRADGALDAQWGDSGLATPDGPAGYGTAGNLLGLDDGGLLAAGTLHSPATGPRFGLVRFGSDGQPSPDFGNAVANSSARTGSVAVAMSEGAHFAVEGIGLARQADGRVLVAGTGVVNLPNGQRRARIAAARFTADGVLDPSFALQGRLFATPIDAATDEIAAAIARRPDGSLDPDDGFILTGTIPATLNSRALVRRYTRDGLPDPSFGTQGVVVLSASSAGGVNTGLSVIRATTLLDDGRVLLLGHGAGRGFDLMRLLPDGRPDPSFGGDGHVHIAIPMALDRQLRALALLPDGRILAAGDAQFNVDGVVEQDGVSLRLLPDGRIDPTYAAGEFARHRFASGVGYVESIAALPEGVVVLGGSTRDPIADRFVPALLRLRGDAPIHDDGFED